MHSALVTSLKHRNRLLALTEEMQTLLAQPGTPEIARVNDLRRRLMMAVIRLQRHKDEAVIPWAFAAGEAAKAWATEIRSREVVLYRRFDEFEDAWPEDSAGDNWAEFRTQASALVQQCQTLIAYSAGNLQPLLMDLSFDYAVEEPDLSEIDWEAERWKILRRYPRLP